MTGYLIERCQGSGCANFAPLPTQTSASYNDTGLAASTSYTYRVRATDAANNLSGYSATASATTQPAGGAQATDNFNRANGGLGANWTINTIGAGLQIVGNRVQTPAGEYSESLHTGTAFSAAQFSEVQHVSGLSAGVINLVVRAREYTIGGVGDGYIGQLNGFESRWKILRVTNNQEFEINSGALTFASNDTFYFEANGSTLTLKKNGVTLGTGTNSQYPSGDSGFGLYSNGGLLVDNWRGGEITSSDTQPPSTPATLTASAASGSQINLSWSASSDNVGVTAYFSNAVRVRAAPTSRRSRRRMRRRSTIPVSADRRPTDIACGTRCRQQPERLLTDRECHHLGRRWQRHASAFDANQPVGHACIEHGRKRKLAAVHRQRWRNGIPARALYGFDMHQLQSDRDAHGPHA